MRERNFSQLKDGDKFTAYYDSDIRSHSVLLKIGPKQIFDLTEKESIPLYSSDFVVNIDWWDALKTPSKIQIMEAHKDGAKIERTCMGDNDYIDDERILNTGQWNWEVYDYRIKPTPKTHTIVIDDKEIEISEESYKQLKESLNEN